ncbi:MAG: Gfo/Idh/MocA family oxidoreductase [Armatimonadetes bacterium]|nr:Gfo/Idh/MocA family oxidoreductase [Armatimonadota bacterium]
MSKINVGIIGTGGIAVSRHMPALARFSDLNIMAVCDVNEASAKSAAEKFNVPHVFADYKKMLQMDELDAIHICTPNFLHVQPAVDALDAGKHVLLEKPIARNAVEGALIVEAAKRSSKKLMIAQCFRFGSEAQFLKRCIDAGDLGEIYFARVWALRRRGVPSWGVFTDKEKQGGGPLIDIGVHMLDLALYLMGHPKPVAASGMAYTKIGNTPNHVGRWGTWDYKNYTVEDFAAGFVRLDNGASLIIESSFAANIAEDRMNVSLLGTKGGADTNPLRLFGEDKGALLDITPSLLPTVDFYEVEIRSFYDAIINDTEPPVTGEQALNVMKILDALYQSSEEGREIRIE